MTIIVNEPQLADAHKDLLKAYYERLLAEEVIFEDHSLQGYGSYQEFVRDFLDQDCETQNYALYTEKRTTQ